MPDFSRRQMLTTGVIGAAGFATAIATQKAEANTQNPPESQAVVNPSGRFAEKVVLITGATSSIGEVTARAFAMEGAIVHFCGRREALGEQIAQSIRDAGGKATYQRADVRVDGDVKVFVDTCVREYGRVDIAFNNAGVFLTPAPLHEISLETYQNLMLTTTEGVFLGMKYEIPYMQQQGGGVIAWDANPSWWPIALCTLCSAITSFSYQQIKSRLSFISIYGIAFCNMAIGYGVISFAGNYAMVLVGLAIAGLGLGLLMPNMSFCLTTATPSAVRGRILGGLTTCLFLGQFLSPLVSQPLSQSVGLDRTYGLAGLAMAGLTIIALILVVRWRDRKPTDVPSSSPR